MQSERIKELEDKLATERNGYGQLWNDYQKLKTEVERLVKSKIKLTETLNSFVNKNKELEKRLADWNEWADKLIACFNKSGSKGE